MRQIILLVWLTCLCIAGSTTASAETRNVVLILIDDLGWSDVGCYGSTYYQTPNIDRLAEQGIRFTNGYAACTVCSPSRAAILTGKSPARLMLTQWLPDGRWDSTKSPMRPARYLSALPLEEVTIAEALRESGYRTGFIGKWHLGTEPYYYPRHQGFDLNVGGRDYGAPGSYFYPFEGRWKIPSTDQVLQKVSPVSGKPGDYLVDRLADEAVRFIEDSDDSPFFLMLSHYAVHAPLQAKPEMILAFENVPEESRQGKPAYAAMIKSVDESVGRVVQALSDAGCEKETLIIFTSDNGGYARATSNAPLRANKGSNYEGGLRVPFIVRWPGRGEAGSVCGEPVTGMDIYPTILESLDLPERTAQHVDGKSLVPLLSGTGEIEREALYWHYPHYNNHPESFPAGVVRWGEWKLLENLETGEISLFNLNEDLGETADRSADQPALASRLHDRLKSWRDEVGADPMKTNPLFQPTRD